MTHSASKHSLSVKVVPLLDQVWVNMADGHCEDPTCPDVYEHIVSTLTTQDANVVWMFAEWALQKNQEVHCPQTANRGRGCSIKNCPKLPTEPHQFIECDPGFIDSTDCLSDISVTRWEFRSSPNVTRVIRITTHSRQEKSWRF